MRKEVKLGMALGAGLIALLVVYLLVTPPNRKGAQLAGGNTPGDVAQPGDLGTPEERAERGALKQDNPAGSAAQKPAAESAKPDAAKPDAARNEGAKPEPGKSGDSWNVLANGKPAPKPADARETKEPAKVAARGGESVPAERSQPIERASGRMYFDPHGAWGGGVSTDAVFGAPRPAAKATIVAGKAPESAAPAAAGTTHVIKQGETLSSIAQSAYGSAAHYPHILKANPTLNPSHLKPGTTITLPPLDAVKSPSRAAEPSAGAATGGPESPKIDSTRQYRVRSGDSLYKIAVSLYGKSSYVEKIYEKNKAAIGADPKRLKLGMVLELPEKPTQLAEAPASPARANTTGAITGDASATPAGSATATIQDGAPAGPDVEK